ncbi:ABC transporter permease [Reichenbachiella sp. MALMAid0571]|uniref:ABC transporter permease n=1 Tax=Reichenbachiella sp. MALMAid0571 TaxID=3143939 RepID=UPI0032DEF723
MNNNPTNITPPKWPLKLLRFFVKKEYLEEVEGDMEEVFQENLESYSEKKAKRLYTWELLKLLRPIIMKNIGGSYRMNQFGMLKTNLKIGWRNMVKYKSYSSINIFGLSVGIASTFLLLMIINYEHSFDNFQYENTYRLADNWKGSGISDNITSPTLPAMLEEYPEIAAGTRFFDSEDIVQCGENYFKTAVHIVDSGFAHTFRFKEVYGNLEQTLSTPNSVAVTLSASRKFFGNENSIGKVVTSTSEKSHFTVGAVLEDPPKNSTIQFEILIPWLNAPDWLSFENGGNWYNTFMVAYIRLQDGTNPKEFEEKLVDFKEKYYLEDRQSALDIVLLPLKDEHKRYTQKDKTLSILTLVAFIILIISCINFMNLSTAQSIGRAKEIGVRKVMGSSKSQLVGQFLTESTLISLLALIFGLGIIIFSVPWVNTYFDMDIATIAIQNNGLILSLLTIGCIVGIASGFYPALVISRLKVVDSLKGKLKTGGIGQYFQNSLIVVQFAFSILLIAATLVIWKQIDYMKTKDLNFDGNNVIAIESHSDLFKDSKKAGSRLEILKQELLHESSIESIASAQSFPGKYWQNYNGFSPSFPTGTATISLRQIAVDHNYFETLKIKLVEGRNFSPDLVSDSTAVIINRTAMEKYGWVDLDDKFLLAGGSETEKFKVVGVVDDYHYQSLENDIQPMIHFYSKHVSNKLIVRFHPDHINSGIALLEKRWSEMDAYEPMEYFFVNYEFDQLYKSHERIATTTTLFSLIAIVIASLGLFSIASFSIRIRRKEVGIRKVLGASMAGISLLLSKRFCLLILVAFIFSIPVVYYASELYLANFVNRIDFEFSIPLLAGLSAFVIAAFSIGLESVKIALSNPVDSLRDE